MANPVNYNQQVATYQPAGLAYLENFNVFISTLNTKFKDFQNLTAQLGTTVNIELPYRFRTADGLVATFQSIEQRLHPLTVTQAKNVSYGMTDQEWTYNLKDYMTKIGKGAIKQLSASIEINVAKNANSSVPIYTVNSNGQSVDTGTLNTVSGPFRFFGDGRTPISSFGQLAKMESFFHEYGSAPGQLKVYLPNMAISAIIDTGANQFTPDRTKSTIQSWDLGGYTAGDCRFYRSNLLPIHEAGNLGNAGTTLTVVSINAAGTQMTLSGATGAGADAVKSGDLGEFLPANGLNFLTFIGQAVSECPVQFRVTADASASGDNVTVNITPPLVSSSTTANQNLNKAIVAGMTLKLMPRHRCGLVVGGDAFYLAMPRLKDKVPFPTSSTVGDTGASIRNYYGSLFGGNLDGYVNDCIFDSTLLQDYSMRVLFPINS
jgi:hypothetical protein